MKNTPTFRKSIFCSLALSALVATTTSAQTDVSSQLFLPDVQGIRPRMSASEVKSRLAELKVKVEDYQYMNERFEKLGYTKYIVGRAMEGSGIYELNFAPFTDNKLTSVSRTVRYGEGTRASAPLASTLRESFVSKFGDSTADMMVPNQGQKLIWIWDRNGRLLKKVPSPLCEELYRDYVHIAKGTSDRTKLIKAIEGGCGIWMHVQFVTRSSGTLEEFAHMVVDFVGIDNTDRQVELAKAAARAKQEEAEVKRARQQKPSI